MWLNTVPECNCTVNECIYDSPSSTGPGGQIDVFLKRPRSGSCWRCYLWGKDQSFGDYQGQIYHS